MQSSPQHCIAFTAFALGIVAGGSFAIALIKLWSLAIFAAGLATFHFLEFYWQSKFHPETTTHNAFLLDHSPEYTTAIVAGIVEMAIRSWLSSLFGDSFVALRSTLTWIGCGMMVSGLILRSAAMIQASSNFSHDLRFNLAKNHQLITTGIYRLCRHPSYLGFALFAVGAQLVLGNLVCSAGFIVVLKKFFSERVKVEEAALLRQYPKEYAEYKSVTPSGILGIK